jgi:hypothetical protein
MANWNLIIIIHTLFASVSLILGKSIEGNLVYFSVNYLKFCDSYLFFESI